VNGSSIPHGTVLLVAVLGAAILGPWVIYRLTSRSWGPEAEPLSVSL
jgi:hypothetical protein